MFRRLQLDDARIISLRKEYAEGTTQMALAAKYGVSQTHVSVIVNREVWRRVDG